MPRRIWVGDLAISLPRSVRFGQDGVPSTIVSGWAGEASIAYDIQQCEREKDQRLSQRPALRSHRSIPEFTPAQARRGFIMEQILGDRNRRSSYNRSHRSRCGTRV